MIWLRRHYGHLSSDAMEKAEHGRGRKGRNRAYRRSGRLCVNCLHSRHNAGLWLYLTLL